MQRHHLKHRGKIVAVLTDHDYRLAPEVEAGGPDSIQSRELNALCNALLEYKALAGEFVPAGIGTRRS